MMVFLLKREIVYQNEKLCIKNEEFRIKTDRFCSNGSFAVAYMYSTGTTCMHRSSTPPQLPSGAYIGCAVQFATITPS